MCVFWLILDELKVTFLFGRNLSLIHTANIKTKASGSLDLVWQFYENDLKYINISFV